MKRIIRCVGWALLLQVIVGALLALLFWVLVGIVGAIVLIVSLFVDVGQLDPLRALDVDGLGRIGDTVVTLIVVAAMAATVTALGATWVQVVQRAADSIRKPS